MQPIAYKHYVDKETFMLLKKRILFLNVNIE